MGRYNRLICIVISSILLCCSCAGQKKEMGETTRVFFGISGVNGMVSASDHGILRKTNLQPYLKYYDFESGEETYLCNKEGCTHTDVRCNAYIGNISGWCGFFYDGQLYVLATDELNCISLWCMDVDGTNQKKVIGNIPGSSINELYLYEDTLFCSVIYEEEAEPGENISAAKQFTNLVACDLKKNTWEVITDTKSTPGGSQILCFGMKDGVLYYEESGFSERISDIVADPDLSTEEISDKLSQVGQISRFMAYHVKTQELTCEWEKQTPGLSGYWLLGVTTEEEWIVEYENQIWGIQGETERVIYESDEPDEILHTYLYQDELIMIRADGVICLQDVLTGDMKTTANAVFTEEEIYRLGFLGVFMDYAYFCYTGGSDHVIWRIDLSLVRQGADVAFEVLE